MRMSHTVVILEKPPSKRRRIRSNGLSFLMHGFITLSDATAYDKQIYSPLLYTIMSFKSNGIEKFTIIT